NYRSGIQIGGFDLLINSSTEPINIDIINTIDNGSDYGMFIGRVSNYNDLPGKDLSGTIKIINPEWKNNIDGTFTKRKQYGRGPVVQLLDLSQSVKKELWRAYKYDKDVEFE